MVRIGVSLPKGYPGSGKPKKYYQSKEYKDAWYQRNKGWINAREAKVRDAKRRVMAHLKKDPCIDCGECYPPYVMDFDHVRGEKVCQIGCYLNTSWKKILEELQKCELVCANCHRERTWGKYETPTKY